MSRRLIASLGIVVAASVALAELLLRPARADQFQLIAILAGPAIIALAITPLLSRWVSTQASIAGAGLAVGLCSLLLGAATSSAASNAMFLSSHDYRLFIVVLLLSSGIALVVGSQLSRPLARDIRRLEHVAGQVAGGDLDVRSAVDRHDEVGATARAIDQMIVALARAEADRARLTDGRRHMFTSIGHDLRTPLSAMRAAVESLEDDVAPDPKRYLAVLSAQITVLDGLLGQMIEFARLESGHTSTIRERVSVTELADESVEALTLLAGRRKVHLEVVCDGPAIVVGNPIEVSRVLRNIVDNAIRHAPAASRVTLTISTGVDEIITEVHDGGPGFPAAFKDVAFEPFTRADPSRNALTGNTGLGLAICKAIIDAHDGRIWLGPGPGGDVRFALPTPEEP